MFIGYSLGILDYTGLLGPSIFSTSDFWDYKSTWLPRICAGCRDTNCRNYPGLGQLLSGNGNQYRCKGHYRISSQF